MTSRFFALILATAGTPGLVAMRDSTAVLLGRCLDDPANASTAGQTECEGRAARSYDQRLNAAYQRLLKILPPAPAQRLRMAQRAWLAFRTADAHARAALYDSRHGTMYVPMQAHGETIVVRDRALQLEAYLRVIRIEG